MKANERQLALFNDKKSDISYDPMDEEMLDILRYINERNLIFMNFLVVLLLNELLFILPRVK